MAPCADGIREYSTGGHRVTLAPVVRQFLKEPL